MTMSQSGSRPTMIGCRGGNTRSGEPSGRRRNSWSPMATVIAGRLACGSSARGGVGAGGTGAAGGGTGDEAGGGNDAAGGAGVGRTGGSGVKDAGGSAGLRLVAAIV